MIRKVNGYWFMRTLDSDGEYSWVWMGPNPFNFGPLLWRLFQGAVIAGLLILIWVHFL